jgi:hypothetical protein
LEPDQWQFGFELMRGLTQWSCVPLNVQLYPPFRWLLTGVWSDDELLAQQDIIEFGSILLSRMMPKFVSCSWTTRIQHMTKEVHPHLDSEKGAQYSPILLRFADINAPCSSLVALIDSWHDSSGLCRANDQACPCLILMLDRHLPGLNQKCQQRVDIADGIVHFPCFISDDGDISFTQFDIAAISFHVGNNPNSGHHRTAVRYQKQWLVYDDNRLPDIMPFLTDQILQNITLIWLIQCNTVAARTINDRSGVAPGTPTRSALLSSHGSTDAERPAQEDDTLALGSAIALLTRPDQRMDVPLVAPPLASSGSASAPSTNAQNDDSDATLTQAAKRARVHEDTTLERFDELLSCPDADVPSDQPAPAP